MVVLFQLLLGTKHFILIKRNIIQDNIIWIIWLMNGGIISTFLKYKTFYSNCMIYNAILISWIIWLMNGGIISTLLREKIFY